MRTVNILGVPFKIEEVDVIDESREGITQGKIKYTKGVIYLRKNQPDAIKRQTLIHEVIHGIFIQIGRDDLSEDEALVQTLAVAIDNTFKLKEKKK